MSELQTLIAEMQRILTRIEEIQAENPALYPMCNCYQNVTAHCPIHHDVWQAPTTTVTTHT